MPHVGFRPVAHTLDDLVQLQQTADQAHAHVLQLRDQYGPPTVVEWTDEQTLAYEQAWKAWREQAATAQAAVTAHATAEEKPRQKVEEAVRAAARHPESAGV